MPSETMPTVNCEECGKPIPTADFDIAGGYAHCRACDFHTPIPAATEVEFAGADADTPAGCWWRDDGVEQQAGAVMRRPIGVFLMLFGSIFGGVPLTLFLLGVKVGKRRVSGSTGAPMDWSVAAIFTAVGSAMLVAGVVLVLGSVRVTIRDGAARVVSGLWPFRLVKSFNVADVRDVSIVDSGARSNNQVMYAVGVHAKKLIKFGVAIRDDRRKWLAATLKKRFASTARSRR
ncbi:MAG: hypothetical protein SFY96_02445 [Planctomycetota bacterium]|nr:hypothetical protein [Planctomycetota bacterium]